jgi:uncharacterized membrane protein
MNKKLFISVIILWILIIIFMSIYIIYSLNLVHNLKIESDNIKINEITELNK